MKFPGVEKTYINIYHGDLEDYVCWFYGLNEWSIPACEETSNGTAITMRVEKEDLHEYDIKSLKEWKKSGGSRSYMLGTILTDLANKDMIPEDDYVIEVSW